MLRRVMADRSRGAVARERKPISLESRGYTELAEIGKGAFGRALLVCRDETQEHFVAKMTTFAHLNAKFKKAIGREVQTMSHISNGGGHPYLVRFRESFLLSNTNTWAPRFLHRAQVLSLRCATYLQSLRMPQSVHRYGPVRQWRPEAGHTSTEIYR
jgi:serine/threonine protein kinase